MTSTASWTMIFPELEQDPVVGDPDAYSNGHEQASRVATTTGEVVTRFEKMTSGGGLDELKGETAEKLEEIVGKLGIHFKEVPPVFEQLDEIFKQHASRLEELHRKAREALARAVARWNDKKKAESDFEDAKIHLAHCKEQVSRCGKCIWPRGGCFPPPGTTEECDYGSCVGDKCEEAQRDRDHCEKHVEECECELEKSLDEARAIEEMEKVLVAATVAAIEGILLKGLEDIKGKLASLLDDLCKLGQSLVDGAKDLASEIASKVAALAQTLANWAKEFMTKLINILAVIIGVILLTLAAIVILVIVVNLLVLIGLGAVLVLGLAGPFPDSPFGAIARRIFGLVGPTELTDKTGDPGGTFDTRTPINDKWDATGGTDEENGRLAMSAALGMTGGSESGFEPKEDEVIIITCGKPPNQSYLVVLSGVTDLSSPHLGPQSNHTPRDTEMHAAGSLGDTGMDSNKYAQMVAAAMEKQGIPKGANVALMGHSFGADTAMDLAADPRFNGPGGYNVTHVMAAGYDSAPQMDGVPSSTKVLAVQNNLDVPVHAEHALEPVATRAHQYANGVDRLLHGDMGGLTDVARSVPNLTVDNIGPAARHTTQQLIPDTIQHGPNHTQVVFSGSFQGAGHHPNVYQDYLKTSDNPDVAAFAQSLADAGYADPGTVTAVDISEK